MVGARVEAKHRFAHGHTRGLVDIDLINASSVDRGNRPGDGMFADSFRQNFAPSAGKQLGIAQTANAVRGIENYSRGDYRSEE